MLGLALLLLHLAEASAQYPGWQYSGSIYLLTTPEGAKLAGFGFRGRSGSMR